jgi:hypothetical protein
MSRRPGLAAALVAAVVLSVFFAPALSGSVQFLSRDAGRHHLPVKRWIADRLARGELPEWNPYDGLGAPVVASAIDAPQHPFVALLVALPFEAGFKAWVLASYLLAALGGYAWARALGRATAGSLGAGLAFTLSGLLVSTSDNLTYLTAFAALPWMLAAGLRASRAPSPGGLAAAGLASALCAAGGDPQAWAIGLVATAVQPLLLARGGLRPAARGAAAASAASLAGAAPFLLPVIAWVPHSGRAAGVGEPDRLRYALAPLRLAELALPGLTRGASGHTGSDVYFTFADRLGGPWYVSVYLGASVIALCALAAAKERVARRLALGAALTAWMALGHRAGFGQLASRLPVLGGLRFWEKLTVWPTLLVAAAAAFGVDALLAGGPPARRFSRLAGAAGIGLALAGAAASLSRARLSAALAPAAEASEAAARLAGNLAGALLAAGTALAAIALVAALAAHRPGARALPALAIAVLALDVGIGNRFALRLSSPSVGGTAGPIADRLGAEPGLPRLVTPFEITERSRPTFPELRPDESAWQVGGRMLYSGFNVAAGVGNLQPATPLPPERLAAFVARQGAMGLFPGAALFGVGFLAVPRDPSVAARAGVLPPYEPVASDPAAGGFLVGVPHRPRVYLAEEARSVSRAEAFDFAASGAAGAPRLTVIEGPVPAGWAAPAGEARIARDLPERVEVAVSTPGRALLVLNDAFAPGWSAEVDGRPAEIIPANALVRAVWVEPGSRTVTFRYRTPGLRLGWAIFTAGAVALLGWEVARRRGRPTAA